MLWNEELVNSLKDQVWGLMVVWGFICDDNLLFYCFQEVRIYFLIIFHSWVMISISQKSNNLDVHVTVIAREMFKPEY